MFLSHGLPLHLLTSFLIIVISSPTGLLSHLPRRLPLPFSLCSLVTVRTFVPSVCISSSLPPPSALLHPPCLLIFVSPPGLLSATLRDPCCMWRSRRALTDRVPTLPPTPLLPSRQPHLLPSINPAQTRTGTETSKRKPCLNHRKTHMQYSLQHLTALACYSGLFFFQVWASATLKALLSGF